VRRARLPLGSLHQHFLVQSRATAVK
jgi:hypothetical protein